MDPVLISITEIVENVTVNITDTPDDITILVDDSAMGIQGPPGATGNPANFICNEVPAGAINGSNATFTTANPFIPGSERVYINGLRIKKVDEYNTLGNTTIISTMSLNTGEIITLDYTKI